MRIQLNESREISKGIFWIVWEPYVEDISEGRILSSIIYCDREGNPVDYVGNSKNGRTNNHEQTWNLIKTSESKGIQKQDWNYFPRGRVEIRNNTISIFVNPNIEADKFKNDILKEFSLLGTGMDVNWIVDGSEHYKCNLDKEDDIS